MRPGLGEAGWGLSNVICSADEFRLKEISHNCHRRNDHEVARLVECRAAPGDNGLSLTMTELLFSGDHSWELACQVAMDESVPQWSAITEM